MATLGTRNLTLSDISKRKDPNGKIAKVVEIMMEDNEVLDDIVMKACNDGTTNKTTVRTGQPAPTWRKIYGGVQSTKSSTEQVVDSCGMCEALPEIDVDLVDKSGDKAATLLSEQIPHIQGMKEAVADTLFYGDTTVNPEQFMGLHERYNVLSTDKTKSGYNVFDAGGTGADNTSIWLVVWGEETVHGIYPEGSEAGLSHKSLPTQLVDATGGGKFEAYVDKYKWDLGLCVKNWKGAGRICNIDVSNLVGETSAADLIKLMIRLSERVKGAGKKAFYMTETVRTMLRIQINDKANVNLTFDEVAGKKVLHFDGIPCRLCEAILETEARIV